MQPVKGAKGSPRSSPARGKQCQLSSMPTLSAVSQRRHCAGWRKFNLSSSSKIILKKENPMEKKITLLTAMLVVLVITTPLLANKWDTLAPQAKPADVNTVGV